MKFLYSCVYALVASTSLLSSSVAAQESKSITELIPLIPTCALTCVIQGIPLTALSDPKATCMNVTLQASISACVQGACNYTEQARLGAVNSGLCEGVPIDESRARLLTIIACVFGPLAIFAILLRTYSRLTITKMMGNDDWTMLVAGMFLIGVLICNFENIRGYGFGRHYWNLDPTKITPLLKIFFAAEIFYVAVITLVKVSILQFYLRVFPTPWFQLTNKITIGLVMAAGFGVLFPIFFQCSPVRGAWDRSIQSKCLNINLLAFATGGIGVGFDIIILLLPVYELLKLNMNLRKKMRVLFMFSLGAIACVTSMIRLKYLGEFARSTDATWDNTIPVIWSLIEICIAIICACLPALRALLSHHIPSLFPSDTAKYANQNNMFSTTSSSTAKISTKTFKTNTLTTVSSLSSKGKIRISDNGLLSPVNGPGSELSPSKRTSWLTKGSVITRDREVVQDVERSATTLPPIFDNGITRNTTVTTKIWVANASGDSGTSVGLESPENKVSTAPHDHDWDGKAGIARSNTPELSNNSSSRDSSPLPLQYPHSPSSTSSEKHLHNNPYHYQTSTREPSRHGSEDSMFILEGPREGDDERERERGRRRRSAAQQSEQGEDDIEMSEMDRRRRDVLARRDEERARRSGSLSRVPVSIFNQNPPVQ